MKKFVYSIILILNCALAFSQQWTLVGGAYQQFGQNISINDLHVGNNNKIYAAMGSGGVYVYENGGWSNMGYFPYDVSAVFYDSSNQTSYAAVDVGIANNGGRQYLVKKLVNGYWQDLGSTQNTNFSLINSIVKDNQGNIFISESNGAIWKWDGNNWIAMQGINSLYGLKTDHLGNLYGFGRVLYSNGQLMHYVAKYNGTDWEYLGGLNDTTFNDDINSISIDENLNVYATGHFTNASGKNYVKKWNGIGWYELPSGNIDFRNFGINASCVDKYGHLYVSGSFLDNTGSIYFAKWNGINWTGIHGVASGSSRSGGYCVAIDTVGVLYAASFDTLVINSSTSTAINYKYVKQYRQTPAINSFTPNMGSSGTVISITGNSFTGCTNVSFGGTNASSFTVVNDTLILAIVGNGATGSVVVTTTFGTTSMPGFTYCNINGNLFSTDTINVCGNSYDLNAGSGFVSYAWNNGATTQTINVSNSGLYKCTVSDGLCSGSDSIYVNLSNVAILNNDTTICRGTSLTLNATLSTTSGVTDIDGDYYPSVNIGNQTWMQKNLNVTRYRNGDPIPQVTSATQWANLTTGAWCWYNNDSATYAATYGKLYNWYAVTDPRGLAPNGWHMPSTDEWTVLTDFLLGLNDAGGKMKEQDTIHWASPNEGATNSCLFTALPGGFRGYQGNFYNARLQAHFWTTTESNQGMSSGSGAWGRLLYNTLAAVGSAGNNEKFQGKSVRGVSDNFIPSPTYLWSTGATTPSITVSPTVSTTYYCTITDGNGNICIDSVHITVNNCNNPCLPSYLPTNGLVGYWPFCGNANDESGNGNNGIVNGATLTSDRFGDAGKAYSFNGVDDYISVNSQNHFSTLNSFTISTWFLLSSYGSASQSLDYKTLFVNSNPWYASNSWSLLLNADALNSTNRGVNLYVGGVLQHQFHFNYPINTWHNVILKIENHTASLFFNGQLIDTANNIAPIPNSNNGALFANGNTLVPRSYLFNGSLDDIAIYNRALNQQEISALYSGVSANTCAANITQNDTTICRGSSVSLAATATTSSGATSTLPTNLQTGLVAYWPFNGNANDESGNGNNGTVNGAVLTTDRFGISNQSFLFNRNVINEINVPSVPILNNIQNITISLWVNLASYGATGQSGYNYFVSKSGQNNIHQFVFANNNSQLFFYNGNNTIDFVTNNLPPLNRWSNLIVTYNYADSASNSKCRFYINGNLVDSFQTYGNLVGSTYNLKIGSLDSAFQNRLDGKIDDIAIWNRALTASEIQQLYNSQSQITNYQWSTGDTTATINVSPTTSTTYYCTITDANGATCTDSVRITVNTAPPARPSFISGAINICSQLGNNATSTPVTYTVNPVPTAVSYYWTVPSGATILSGQGTGATQVVFSSAYTTGIIYVTAINACDSSSSPRGLTVTKRTAAQPGSIYKSFVPVQQTAVTSVCGVASDTFMIRRVQFATSYLWTLSSGAQATITHLSSPGILDTSVRLNFSPSFIGDTLKVKALTDCSVSDARYIVLSSGRPATGIRNIVNAANNFSPCIGDTLTYTASSNVPSTNQAPIVMYRWTLAPYISITSASADSSVIHVKFNAGFNGGVISVRGQSACGGLGSPKTYYFRYTPPTPANITSSNGSYNACTGNQFSFTVVDTAALAASQRHPDVYRWTIPAGAVIIWGSSDSSTITLQFNNNFNGGNLYACGQTSCGVQGLQKRVTLANSGCASCTANIVNNDTTICAGDSVTLTATVTSNAQQGSGLSGTLLNGLVGYWPFNGNANDESGNGNNGTVNGATLTTDRFGNTGKAYSFDGVSNLIELGDLSYINSGILNEYSVSIWVNLAQFNTPLNGGQCMIFGDEISQNNGTIFQIHTTNGFGTYTAGSNGWYCNCLPTLNTWTNYVVVQNNNGQFLYINGVLWGLLTSSLNSEVSTQIRLGLFTGCSGACQRPLNGKLDDIAIYNRALTQTEVQQLYNSQSQITNYQWSNGATTPTITVSPSQTTTYTCTITSGNGAVCTDSVRVTVNNNCITSCIANIINNDTTICAGQPVTLTATSTATGGSGLSGTLQNGLVGYWPFNGNANDESGNGNNGTVNGNVSLTTDRFGNNNNAFDFNGGTISVPHQTYFSIPQSGEFSVNVWVKKTGTQNPVHIIGKRGQSAHQFNWIIAQHTTPGGAAGGGLVFTGATSSGESGIGYNGISDSTIQINQWDHLVGTYSNGNWKLYKNGLLCAQKSSTIYAPDVNNPALEFGDCGGWGAFIGKIDDIAIWNRALTPQEVQQLYTGATTSGVTDIDGNNYPTVNIGTQTWTQKNLNVSRYRNGDPIPQVTDPTAWANLTTGAWCWYNNDSSTYAATYGKLYNWYTVNDPRGLAPQGWHVPSNVDWNNMIKYLDPVADTACYSCWQSDSVGGWLKTTNGWIGSNVGASNRISFSALPGGSRKFDGSFFNAGYTAFWWGTTPINPSVSWNRSIDVTSAGIARADYSNTAGFSIRCLKDVTTNPQPQIPNYLWSNGATTPTITVNPTQSTTYYCTVTYGNVSCVDSVRVTVSQTVLPTPSVISGPADVCPLIANNASSGPVTYRVQPVAGATSYQWTVPAGATLLSGQGDTLITVSFSSSFVSGNIGVTASGPCGNSAGIRELNVIKRVPSVPGTIAKQFVPTQLTAITSVCNIPSETYMIRSVEFATSYLWTMSNGANVTISHMNNSGAQDTAVVLNFGTGFTTDTLTVRSVSACSVSDGKTIILTTAAPTAAVRAIANAGGNFAPCIGDVLTYTASAFLPTTAQSAIQVFRWTLAPGAVITSATLPDSATITVSFTPAFNGGIISARGQSACGGLGSAKTVYFQYLPPTPSSIVASSGNYNPCIGDQVSYTVFVGTIYASQRPASVYRWTIPARTAIISANADSSVITLQFLTGYTGGSLKVKGQTVCGAQGTAKTQVLTHSGCPAGTRELYTKMQSKEFGKLEVTVMPNPTSSYFNMRVISEQQAVSTVKLYDVQGRLLKTMLLKTNEIKSFGSDLRPGVYMAEVLLGEVRRVLKVVKI